MKIFLSSFPKKRFISSTLVKYYDLKFMRIYNHFVFMDVFGIILQLAEIIFAQFAEASYIVQNNLFSNYQKSTELQRIFYKYQQWNQAKINTKCQVIIQLLRNKKKAGNSLNFCIVQSTLCVLSSNIDKLSQQAKNYLFQVIANQLAMTPLYTLLCQFLNHAQCF